MKKTKCDHCGQETMCHIDTYYDIQLCDACNDRFFRSLWRERQSLQTLERQQRMFERMAVPYEYSNDPR